MTPKTIRAFGAVYALLFLVLIGSGLGAYAAYNIPSVKRDVKAVKASLGDSNLGRVANEYITRTAKAQGYTVRGLTVLKIVEGKDSALVSLRVTLADPTGSTQTLNLVVTLHRGVWSAINAAAA